MIRKGEEACPNVATGLTLSCPEDNIAVKLEKIIMGNCGAKLLWEMLLFRTAGRKTWQNWSVKGGV